MEQAGLRSRLVLEKFLPFRLNRLADAVSQHLSEIYRHRFALDIPEWRVLVTVGERGGCTAQDIVASTRMHKTRVSRAVASLEERRIVVRRTSTGDGRAILLQLTATGCETYQALAPLALERERALLACLSAAEAQALHRALERLEQSLRLTAGAAASVPALE